MHKAWKDQMHLDFDIFKNDIRKIQFDNQYMHASITKQWNYQLCAL